MPASDSDRSPTARRGVDLALLRQDTGVQLRTTPATMRYVLYALVPGTLAYALLIEARILFTVVIAAIAAMAFEALALTLRKRDVIRTVSDGSAALTGVLIALSVTPLLPVWQLIVGAGIAILLAKHAYGGLGYNPFNPAMVAFAVLLVSFPADMSHWPGKADPANETVWDTVTAQTPRDRWRELLREQRHQHMDEKSLSSASAKTDDTVQLVAVGWRWSSVALAWLLGGLFLLWSRVISWQAPTAFIVTLALCHSAASVFGTTAFDPSMTLLSGAALFGAFFIITDPVSGAATARGRLLFGCGVGLISFLIRQFGSWPEGLAFAVLIMNSAVPLIDRLDTPRHPR